MLGWEHMQITFHTFRRSGASWAFQHGVPIDAIKNKAHGIQIAYGDIFIHILKLILILSYKLFNYTYPIDGCLGECFYVLLSCLLLINPLSKKIQGNFPLGHFRGITLSKIHLYFEITQKLTSYSRLTSLFLTIVKLGYYIANCGFQLYHFQAIIWYCS